MVCFDGHQLLFWKMTSKGAKRPDAAAAFAKKMIDRYAPDWVIFEDPKMARCKGENTKQLISAMIKVARHSQANCMVVERVQGFKNKYEEADALIKKHPKLHAVAIKRDRAFDLEPRATVVFEAVALAEAAQRRPVTDLAAAMG